MSRDSWSLALLLSPARMRPYLDATNDRWEEAIALYDWNASVSAAFFESLHYLEVGLRNALDQAVVEHVGIAWLATTSPSLTTRSRQIVALAQGRAGGPDSSRGKLIAELPFGFWWSLLADEYNRRLWQPALRHAFDGPVRRRTLHAELDEMRRLRNRIAHHEPVHARELRQDYARLLDTAGRVATALGDHIAKTSRVPQVLESKPTNT